MFPDAVTTRGQKHLRELIAMKKRGHRAVVFFAGLHNGFDCFKVAEYIDPEYDKLLQEAMQEGVEVYAYAGKFDFSDKNQPHFLSPIVCLISVKSNRFIY